MVNSCSRAAMMSLSKSAGQTRIAAEDTQRDAPHLSMHPGRVGVLHTGNWQGASLILFLMTITAAATRLGPKDNIQCSASVAAKVHGHFDSGTDKQEAVIKAAQTSRLFGCKMAN